MTSDNHDTSNESTSASENANRGGEEMQEKLLLLIRAVQYFLKSCWVTGLI